jgi:alcohol dehydrogenase class IV
MSKNYAGRTLRFRMPTNLEFGIGARYGLPEACRRLTTGKVLIVTDTGLVACGLVAQLEEILRGGGIEYGIFDGVEPDPRIELVQKCAEVARGYECIIGFGGGSSLDIAKLAAIIARHGGDIRDSIGIDATPGRGIPTILIPTTAGTGSEVTPIAVLSDKEQHLKKGVVSGDLYADLALVDPELMIGLPASVTAFTGMDALTHCIEAYTNRFAQPFVDAIALEGIRLVGNSLRRAVCNGEDIEARSAMALASVYGGMCLGPVNTAAVHALAYPLGGTFNVPHGVANSLLLPYVMEYNMISNLEKFRNIALALGEELDGLSLRESAERSVIAVRQLAADAGIVTQMSSLDIPKQAIQEMAGAAMKVTRLLNNNPRTLREQDVIGIYTSAW